jgi:ubiquitin-protein ligase E3 A
MSTRVYQFNPLSLESTIEFELIGIVLGLALYNSIILDIRFPLYIYKKLLNQPTSFSDLVVAHPALAKGLKSLLDDQTEQVEEVYARQFTVDIERYGESEVVELKPGGADIPLTSINRHEYVQLYTDYVLNRAINKQFTAFKKGFDLCVPASLLVLFQPEELELLICGSDVFDWQQLRESARYDDGYTEQSNMIGWFWECVQEWDEGRKRKLLMFCTGSDRAPIRGLGSLRLTISKNGGDSELLPTSHTCFNHLLLPEYGSKDKLKRLLELALDNAHGFGLI